jgi:hypothetical protein
MTPESLTFHLAVDGQDTARPLPVELAAPVDVEFWTPSQEPARIQRGYDDVDVDGEDTVGTASLSHAGWTIRLEDRWRHDADALRVDRSVRVLAAGPAQCGIRVELQGTVRSEDSFNDSKQYAPPALFNMNDIDGDGIEDYVDDRELIYRDDRLTALTVLTYQPTASAAVSLTRLDAPRWDDVPERSPRDVRFLQATDIGSLGLAPSADERTTLIAAHPFVERGRSHALTAQGREPWGAYFPLSSPDGETPLFAVSYAFRTVAAHSDIDALWGLWRTRVAELDPVAVELEHTLEDITRLRVDALLPYYAEGEVAGERAAGFVTNCHPQDGIQLGNVIQYGFTGQNVLNALHAIHHAHSAADHDARAKGLNVVDFFVSQALKSAYGLTPTLYDLERGRSANWWSGLILPLAYAEEGDNLQELMGPVYDHMKYAIDPLRDLEGTYLRCMAEEHTALLRAFRDEAEAGHVHDDWLTAATRFGDFLLDAQEEDGTWRRAYGFDGDPIVEPRAWFGVAELNQKSSTATAVPFLVALAEATADSRYLAAAQRAERFTAEKFVRDVKHNGGIHDSIYARAQLVDSESILFCLRASLAVWRATGDAGALSAATDAARLLATWVYLWDVPLPPSSTLAQYGFRSTGWSACDTSGAGYIHPYELHAVPDLFEVALAAGDSDLARIAQLILSGSSQNVATPSKSWGYARNGLQEEGVLVSWWLIDDPMFVGTHFGGRGKGEGNKTCLPWISAVGIDAHDILVRRYGTSDLAEHWASR